MLNFREELSKIKEEKLKLYETDKNAENFLKDLLEKLKNLPNFEFLNINELYFALGGETIYVKVENGSKEAIYSKEYENEEAMIIFKCIKTKLKEEGFNLTNTNTKSSFRLMLD